MAFGALGLALVLVAAAASSLYLERTRLLTLADGAALAGAEAFGLDDVETTGDGRARPRLADDEVRRAVTDYLEQAPAAGFDGLLLEAAGADDDRSATVTLSSIWRPPVVTPFFPEGLRIEATAVARSVIG